MRMRCGLLAGVVATTALLAGTAGPAAAHVIVVSPPNGNTVATHGGAPLGAWVGGPPLPASAAGAGLIAGGPGGDWTLTPAHDAGLNSACEAQRAGGRSAASIFGPPSPAGCPHGT